MAHAYQPNFPHAYDPDHKVIVNKGPVIKVNANQRYSTESISEATFAHWCEQAAFLIRNIRIGPICLAAAR